MTGPAVAGLGLDPRAPLPQCPRWHLPRPSSGSRAENARFVPHNL